MKITINSDYTGFKAVCAELSGANGPSHFFYGGVDGSGNLTSLLAIFIGGFYAEYTGAGVVPATVTADFPNAVNAGTNGIVSAY